MSVSIIFFSDFIDGPISGWEGSTTKGAAVTIWGLNFGDTRGTSYVSVGGVNLTSDSDYAEWSRYDEPETGEEPVDVYKSARGLRRICFYLNSSMSLGDTTISVTTSDGTSSTIPFYTRAIGANHIYFVSPTGNNSNNGLYSTQGAGVNGPWLDPYYAKRMMLAGDITYFREGVYNNQDPASSHYGSSYTPILMVFRNDYSAYNNGSENQCIGMASYPGEIAQLGDNSINVIFFRWGRVVTDLNYWTFSKFLMRAFGVIASEGSGAYNAIDMMGTSVGVRYIGNDIHTSGWTNAGANPYSAAGTALSLSGQVWTTELKIYGNQLSDAGVFHRGDSVTFSSRAYSLYIQGDGRYGDIDIGWNELAYNHKGRGVQVYGHWITDNIENLYFHDNYSHHNGFQGAVIGGGDGGGGSIDYSFITNAYIYNNIFFNNGYNSFDYVGVYSPGLQVCGVGYGGNGGNWYVWNNTLYNNASYPLEIVDGGTVLEIKNNIVYSIPTRTYLSSNSSSLSGGNNLWFNGSGSIPSWDASPITIDPLFISSSDFSLQPGSLCRDAGTSDVSVVVTKDYLGILRPQNGLYDIGAYEYVVVEEEVITYLASMHNCTINNVLLP